MYDDLPEILPYEEPIPVRFSIRRPTAREMALFSMAQQGSLDAALILMARRAEDGMGNIDFFERLPAIQAQRHLDSCLDAMLVGIRMERFQLAYEHPDDVAHDRSRSDVQTALEEFLAKADAKADEAATTAELTPDQKPVQKSSMDSWLTYLKNRNKPKEN